MEPSVGRMPMQRGSSVRRLFTRSLAGRRWRFSSVSLWLLALLSLGDTQEPLNSPADVQALQHLTPTLELLLIATPSFPQAPVDNGGATADPSYGSAVPFPETAESKHTVSAAIQQAVGPHATRSLEEHSAATAEIRGGNAPEADDADCVLRLPPITATVVVGAAETVRDCTQKAHSQTFLMGLARRFQQLQLLPLLIAIGQQGVRVVASNTRTQAPQEMVASLREVVSESLLLHPYPSLSDKPKPAMLMEMAAGPSLAEHFEWRGRGSPRARSAALPPVYVWPDGRGRYQSHSDQPVLRQSGLQVVPQSQLFRNTKSPLGRQQPLAQPVLHRGFGGDLKQQSGFDGASTTAAPSGASFAEGLMKALDAAPLIRVNLGDLACAALATSGVSRKLSCWLMRVFTDRILCRTAWFDACQALSDLDAHGKALLSPIVLPSQGSATLALPLKPLVHQHRGLPPKIPRDVVLKEGPIYQLLWQSLARLDDMWALAYCDRKLPADLDLRFHPDPTEDPQQTDKQQQQQQPERPHRQGQGNAASADMNPHVQTGIPAPEPPGASATAEQQRGPDDASNTAKVEAGETATVSGARIPPTRGSADGIPICESRDLLPGWRTELTLRALSPGVGIRTNVLAIVGRRGSEVLVAFRGTKTQVEWILNGQAEHAFKWLPEGEGRTAAGFSHIFSAAWPALQVYLASVDTPEKPITRILVTGYSLGGAVAGLMAYGIALSYPEKVEAVLFGSPRIGDAAFAASWARKVNGRSIEFTLDPIPRTPCREMPACDKPGKRGPLTLPTNFLKWASTTPRISGAGGGVAPIKAINNYGDLHGRVSFVPEELGGSVGSRVNPLYASYNHICSYPCWLTTNFNPADRRTLCEMPDPSQQWSPALTSETCPALLS